MNISIIGSGYVGLVTGVCLAKKGHNVICYDVNKNIIDSLNSGKPTFFEPGLNDALTEVIDNKYFKAKNIDQLFESNSKLIMIAVGTPSKNGDISLKYISSALKIIARYIKSVNYFVSVVIKSTVLPGTTDTFAKNIIEKHTNKVLGQFGLGMNPEFLREGNAIEDAENPDRIILGFCDDKTLNLLRELYKPWNALKIEVNSRTAEMIKYTNNSLLATQISAVNEIANIAQQIGNVDISEVMKGVLSDKRWNVKTESGKHIRPEITKYLVPGCGFGGSCFPKDVEAFEQLGIKLGLKPKMLKAVLDINKTQPNQILKILKTHLPKIKNRTFLVLGLAFKPNTDDVRQSISLKVIRDLLNENAKIIAHDPKAIKNVKKIFKNQEDIHFTKNWESYLDSSDVILVMTSWDQYKILRRYNKKLKNKIVFDARRFFHFKEFSNSTYLTIGRSL